MIPSVLCVALLVGAAVEANDAQQSLRSYDIAAFVRSAGPDQDSMAMLPYVWASGGTEPFELDAEHQLAMNADQLVELIRTLIQPVVWEETIASVDCEGSRLLVEAPDAVHAEIEDLLGFLAEALLDPERLEVSVYRGTVPSAPVLPTVAEADRMLQEALAAGTLTADRSTSVSLARGTFGHGESVDLDRFVFDYEVEIAQGACIADPIIVPLQTGLTVSARGSRTDRGLLLDVLLRDSVRLDSGEPVELRSLSQLNNKTQVVQNAFTAIVERPEVAFTSLASSFLLPYGRAAWVQCELETESGPVSALVDFRLRGADPARRSEHRLTLEDYDGVESTYTLRVQDFGAVATSAIHVPRISPFHFDGALWDECWSGNSITGCSGELEPLLSLERAIDLLWSREPIVDEDPSCMVLGLPTATILSVLPPEVDARARRTSEMLRAPGPVFQLNASIRGQGEAELGWFRCPLSLGRRSSLWAGVQSTGVYDWDVDVANESACANPEMLAVVDGLAMVAKLDSVPRGELSLELSGKVHLLTGAAEDLDLRNQSEFSVTKAPARALAIDDRIPWKPGSMPVRIGDRHLAVDVELTPQN